MGGHSKCNGRNVGNRPGDPSSNPGRDCLLFTSC